LMNQVADVITSRLSAGMGHRMPNAPCNDALLGKNGVDRMQMIEGKPEQKDNQGFDGGDQQDLEHAEPPKDNKEDKAAEPEHGGGDSG